MLIKRLGVPTGTPSPLVGFKSPGLSLADAEHFGAAYRADTLGSGLPVLHPDVSGVLHLPLGAALHAVGLHLPTSLFDGCQYDKPFYLVLSIVLR